MKLNKFDNKLVRLVTIDNEIFEGYCVYNSSDYNEHEYGRDEPSIQIENFLFYEDDIEEIKIIKEYSSPYSDLEKLTVEDGIDFIEDVLESEEITHVIRLLDYLTNKINKLDCKEEVIKILKQLTKNDNKEIQERAKQLIEKES